MRLRRIITCGEPLPPSLRAELEKHFGQKIVNFYGAGESLALGVETDPEEGMILFDDLNIIECRGDEMLVTCLYNFAQPLIRYRLRDRLLLRRPEALPAFTRARGTVFRDEDILWFEDREGSREYLHPLSVEGLSAAGLQDFQFIQTDKDALTMLAVCSEKNKKPEVRRELLQRIGAILSENGLSYVKFHVRFADVIESDPVSGKKKLIVPYTGGLRRETA